MSDVLTKEEWELVDEVIAVADPAAIGTADMLVGIVERLVAEVERLHSVRVAAVSHLLRPDIGFREKRSHTPACRPGSGGNENYCSTCALQKAIEESHT